MMVHYKNFERARLYAQQFSSDGETRYVYKTWEGFLVSRERLLLTGMKLREQWRNCRKEQEEKQA